MPLKNAIGVHLIISALYGVSCCSLVSRGLSPFSSQLSTLMHRSTSVFSPLSNSLDSHYEEIPLQVFLFDTFTFSLSFMIVLASAPGALHPIVFNWFARGIMLFFPFPLSLPWLSPHALRFTPNMEAVNSSETSIKHNKTKMAKDEIFFIHSKVR
jgi:hypothetical protein